MVVILGWRINFKQNSDSYQPINQSLNRQLAPHFCHHDGGKNTSGWEEGPDLFSTREKFIMKIKATSDAK